MGISNDKYCRAVFGVQVVLGFNDCFRAGNIPPHEKYNE
jgi:hypothetical protein